MRHAALACPIFYLLTIQIVAHAQNVPAAAAREPVLMTISKETTRITEPLKESGYPDFLEAVNIAKKGKITADTNGAILVLRVAGHDRLDPEQVIELSTRLGIDPLPGDQTYFLNSDDYVDNLDAAELPKPNAAESAIEDDAERILEIRSRLSHEFEHCRAHPWSNKDHPHVQRWLESQQAALERIKNLRDYPEGYIPFVKGAKDDSLLAAQLWLLNRARRMGLDLNIRAMRSIDAGDLDLAMDDLERMLAMRNHLQNPMSLIENLVAVALGSAMHPTFNAIVLSPDLSSKQLERLRAIVEKLDQPTESLIEVIDRGDRLLMIESICRLAEYCVDGTPEKRLSLKSRQNLDYDLILRHCNEFYDRAVAKERIKDPQQRQAARDQFNKDLDALADKNKSKVQALLNFVSKENRSQAIANILIGLFMPATEAFADVETKKTIRRDLWQLALALAKYRLAKKTMPADLNMLVPEYIAAIPNDHFSGKPLKYQAAGPSLLLYSIGRDGEDHQGYNGDSPDGVTCDDLAIFTEDHRPQPPKPAEPPRE